MNNTRYSSCFNSVKYVFIIALLSVTSSLHAQMLDRIHLVSGKSYTGIIIEQIPGKSVKMLTYPSKDTVSIQYTDILKLSKIEAAPLDADDTSSLQDNPSQATGINPAPVPKAVFAGQLHIASFAGEKSGTSFGASFGVRIKQRSYIGAEVTYFGQTSDPVYSRSTYNNILAGVLGTVPLTRHKVVNAFASLGMGYSYNTSGYTPYNGSYFFPAIGADIKLHKSLGVFASVGYLRQQYRDPDSGVKNPWDFIVIKGGFRF